MLSPPHVTTRPVCAWALPKRRSPISFTWPLAGFGSSSLATPWNRGCTSNSFKLPSWTCKMSWQRPFSKAFVGDTIWDAKRLTKRCFLSCVKQEIRVPCRSMNSWRCWAMCALGTHASSPYLSWKLRRWFNTVVFTSCGVTFFPLLIATNMSMTATRLRKDVYAARSLTSWFHAKSRTKRRSTGKRFSISDALHLAASYFPSRSEKIAFGVEPANCLGHLKLSTKESTLVDWKPQSFNAPHSNPASVEAKPWTR